MRAERVEEMVAYIQERCLWQFHSRAWDREDNIAGVLSRTAEILTGREARDETEADRCWRADAKVLAAEFKSAFPWLGKAKPDEVEAALEGVKARMLELTVAKSRNEELRLQNY
jgi:nitrogenase delta subunit